MSASSTIQKHSIHQGWYRLSIFIFPDFSLTSRPKINDFPRLLSVLANRPAARFGRKREPTWAFHRIKHNLYSIFPDSYSLLTEFPDFSMTSLAVFFFPDFSLSSLISSFVLTLSSYLTWHSPCRQSWRAQCHANRLFSPIFYIRAIEVH